MYSDTEKEVTHYDRETRDNQQDNQEWDSDKVSCVWLWAILFLVVLLVAMVEF